MVNLGVTHNFISSQVIKLLGVNCDPSKSFGVSLGMGETVLRPGECK